MLKSRDISELFTLPIISAIRAQSMAVEETISYIQEFGLDESGKTKSFSIKTERMIEENIINSTTKKPETITKLVPIKIDVPLLALFPPPALQIQEMNFEFGIDIVQERPSNTKSMKNGGKGKKFGSRGVFKPVKESNPPNVKVSMKITKDVPEGISKLQDILVENIVGKPIEEKGLRTISIIKGITTSIETKLNEEEIMTIDDFVDATKNYSLTRKLASKTKIDIKKLTKIRDSAITLMKK